jgi:ribonuclease D
VESVNKAGKPSPQSFPVLSHPAQPVPPVIETQEALDQAAARLADESGPLAVDTERAHGFRYTTKAYLIQLRRGNSQCVLIDPVAFEAGESRADLSWLAAELADAEWVIHAANQDLPCLAEVGFLPQRLFDTELAARLLNWPKVNLNTVAETALQVTLKKEHSAADWSTRPLPATWLNYAALDVELLADLRDWMEEKLTEAGKLEWAQQEFAHLIRHAGDVSPPPRDPWRRTSGLHQVHTPRGLAVVRGLWLIRDELAEETDLAPGRILKDRAIVELASKFDRDPPTVTRKLIRSVSGFLTKRAVLYEDDWLHAVQDALALPRHALPSRQTPSNGIPHPRTWERTAPDASERWDRVRPAVVARAEELEVPVENLIAPAVLRELVWSVRGDLDVEALVSRLRENDVREWQVEALTGTILEAW